LEAGLGIALQPDFLAWEAVRDGRLAAVLKEWDAPSLMLSLVTPGGGPRAQRIAVLMDYLVRHFGSGNAPWMVASDPRQ
jgi:DNA-binding transcriptional LysR family regulator